MLLGWDPFRSENRRSPTRISATQDPTAATVTAAPIAAAKNGTASGSWNTFRTVLAANARRLSVQMIRIAFDDGMAAV